MILTDTGFWIGLFDDKDSHHSQANAIFDQIRKTGFKISFPYSIYNELLRTTFFKGHKLEKISRLEKIMEEDVIDVFDDAKYKEKALPLTIEEGKKCRDISYTDNLIRLIIEDKHEHIKYLITFDIKHFVDICRKYKVEIFDKCYKK